METTMLIAKLLGPVMLLMGIGFLFSSSYYEKLFKKAFDEKLVMLLGAIVGIVAGAFVVGNHNMWGNFSEIIISFIGWIMLIKGAVIVAFPKVFKGLIASINYSKGLLQIAGIIYILLGIYLVQGVYM